MCPIWSRTSGRRLTRRRTPRWSFRTYRLSWPTTRNVRFGFIEFVDDLAVPAALLRAVEDWGRSRGMDTVVGPMGIFDFDKEGMLVEDFDQLGSSITIYNPPYYPRHLEALGYVKEVDWVQARIEVPAEVPARYARTAALAQEMYGLRVRKISVKEMLNGYGRRVFQLLNQAYAPLYGYTELMDRQIDDYVKRYLPIIDLRLVPVVENAEGELVGAAVTMSSLSRALQQSGGRLWPFGWFYLLRALRWKRADKADLYLVAVRPDYQGLGVNWHPLRRDRPPAGGQREGAVPMEAPASDHR